MKKIILGGIAFLLAATTLVGCNTSEDATVTQLTNELDKTNNSVSNAKTLTESDLEVTEEVLDKLATENQSENIQRNIYIAKNAIQNEQNCKNEVMAKTARIKKYLSKNDLKLAKNQTSALKDLSKNLSAYNNSISYSEKEFNSAIKNYNNIKKNAGKNPERVNAKLNRIACNSNARCAYYENLLNTLNQVEDVLGIEEYNPYSNENYDYGYIEQYEPQEVDNLEETEEHLQEGINEDESETPKQEKPKKRRFKKNIDTYLNEEDKEQNLENLESENPNYNQNNGYLSNHLGKRNLNNYNADTYGPTKRNIDTYRPYNYGMPYNNGMNGMNGMYPYGGYNTPYNYPYVNGGNGMYNTPYGYNSNNFNRIATPYVNTEEVNEEEEVKITPNEQETNEENEKPEIKYVKVKRPEKIKNRKILNKELKDANLNNNIQNFNNNDLNKIENNETKEIERTDKNCEDCDKLEEDKINGLDENCENCTSSEIKKDIGEPRLEEFENEEMKIKEINTSSLDVTYVADDEERVKAN